MTRTEKIETIMKYWVSWAEKEGKKDLVENSEFMGTKFDELYDAEEGVLDELVRKTKTKDNGES